MKEYWQAKARQEDAIRELVLFVVAGVVILGLRLAGCVGGEDVAPITFSRGGGIAVEPSRTNELSEHWLPAIATQCDDAKCSSWHVLFAESTTTEWRAGTAWACWPP